MTTHSKIQKLQAELNATFLERDHHIEMCLLAVLARVHVLMLGKPGTGKSALTRALAQALGGKYWEKLMTRFTAPDELFGPPKFSALKLDRFERETMNTILDCSFPFVDEVFKAGSAILNTLLTAMNERVFHNGSQGILKLPLVTLFGASNELPEGKELEALFDRFLVRLNFDYVAQQSSKKAMVRGAGSQPIKTSLTLAEVEAAQAEVIAVTLTDACVDGVLEIHARLAAEGIEVSDRRLQALMALVKAAAWMDGETEAAREHLGVITDALWREPKERTKVQKIVGEVADPVGLLALGLLDAAHETAAKAKALRNSERGAYLKAVGDAKEAFEQTVRQLNDLAKTAGKRAAHTVASAKAEVQALDMEMARAISAQLGLGALRGGGSSEVN
jgi:MoxR-like ATPase